MITQVFNGYFDEEIHLIIVSNLAANGVHMTMREIFFSPINNYRQIRLLCSVLFYAEILQFSILHIELTCFLETVSIPAKPPPNIYIRRRSIPTFAERIQNFCGWSQHNPNNDRELYCFVSRSCCHYFCKTRRRRLPSKKMFGIFTVHYTHARTYAQATKVSKNKFGSCVSFPVRRCVKRRLRIYISNETKW